MSISKIMSMVLNQNMKLDEEPKSNRPKSNRPKTDSTIDNIVKDLEYYMFSKENLIREKSPSPSPSPSHTYIPNFIHKPKDPFFSPHQRDGLFWCFYVMKYGEVEYEKLNQSKITLITEKKIKIDYIEKLRQEKAIFKKTIKKSKEGGDKEEKNKTMKFPSLSHIENQLANEVTIDILTFLSLCYLEKLPVIYVHKKTYFELLIYDKDEDDDLSNIHIIECKNEEKGKKYIYKGFHSELVKKYQTTLFKVENIEKPVKALSSYKVAELMEFSQQLGLETTYKDEKEKEKNKSKQALYEQIVQYFG